MLEFNFYVVAGPADDVCVCENVVAVRVGIEDDSTASGVAGEDSTACPQDAIGGGGMRQAGIGGRCSSDRNNDESDGKNATHLEASV